MAYTTIDDPSAHFQPLVYTGGSGSLVRTFDGNSDLQPDWTWHKSRGQTYDHYLFDSTRGVGLYLKSNNANGDDGTGGDTTSLTSFDSNGFTLPGGTGITDTGALIVCWAWKANGGTTTTNDASSTSVGTIDSVYQANTTAGFSIVTFTGTGSAGTIAHGLGSTPQVIITKDRGAVENWIMHHHTLGATFIMRMDDETAKVDAASYNDTLPASTVFSVDDGGNNQSGNTYVSYCFAEKQGYSKFGSYTGNNSNDGPFVYTGFKPAWVMIKNSSAASQWVIIDAKRDPFNVTDARLRANTNAVEVTEGFFDFLSNGFKVRLTGTDKNDDTNVYIYMAFAEQPFVSSEGVPTTAR